MLDVYLGFSMCLEKFKTKIGHVLDVVGHRHWPRFASTGTYVHSVPSNHALLVVNNKSMFGTDNRTASSTYTPI